MAEDYSGGKGLIVLALIAASVVLGCIFAIGFVFYEWL